MKYKDHVIIREIEHYNESESELSSWQFREINDDGSAILEPEDHAFLAEKEGNQILSWDFFAGNIDIDDNDGYTNCNSLEEAKQHIDELTSTTDWTIEIHGKDGSVVTIPLPEGTLD